MTGELKSAHRSAHPDVVAAVSELLVRYATSIDTRDWQLFRSCFTEDCNADYGELPDGHHYRWDNVEEMANWMEAAHRDMGHTLHRITNQRVEGEGTSVTARCYVAVILTAPGGELIVDGAGFYDDAVLQTTEGWKIAKRRFTSVRMQAGSWSPPAS